MFAAGVLAVSTDPSFLNQFHFQPLPAAVAKLSDAQIAKISG